MAYDRQARDLPEVLELPLVSGAPHWYWLGGRPALDFVNTRRERWRRDVETLVTAEDLGRWLVEAGLLAEPMRVPREVLNEARELREAINAVTVAATEGTPPSASAVSLIDRWIVHAGTRPHVSLDDSGQPVLGERGPTASPRRALGTIALDAARMIGLPEQRERVRICASDTCSARFYDRSPAGARVWCSMRLCGNVAKARRHRDRRRARTAA